MTSVAGRLRSMSELDAPQTLDGYIEHEALRVRDGESTIGDAHESVARRCLDLDPLVRLEEPQRRVIVHGPRR